MKAVFIIILLFCVNSAQGAKVALAIENLPSTDAMSLINAVDINNKVLGVLEEYKIPAIGFVNVGRIYTDSNSANRINILKKWLSQGLELGNQSYTNKSLNLVPDEEYFGEIIKGEKVLSQLMSEYKMKLRYFMPSYLHLGTNARSYNHLISFLEAHGYKLVPVTITNDDWLFNRDYIKAIEIQDLDLAVKIKKRYIQYTEKRFEFYVQASRQIFGLDIDQILLLHLNKINEDSLEEIVKIPAKFGYSYDQVDHILKTFPYNDKKYWGFTKSGISWIRRFDDLDSRVVNWSKEPQNEDYLADLFISD